MRRSFFFDDDTREAYWLSRFWVGKLPGINRMNVQTSKPIVAEDRDAVAHHCRLCGSHVDRTFVDLGMSPLCESFVPADKADHMEPYFPLHALVCGECSAQRIC